MPDQLARSGIVAPKFCPLAMATISLVAAFASPMIKAQGPISWSRFLTDANAFAATPGIPFVISSIDYENYTLSAFCWYRYTEGTDPVRLHGKKEADGKFWPVIGYEVATEGKTKWKKIVADTERSDSDSILVSPDKPIAKLWVNMKPFRKAIGVLRYGRLVLENGETATLELEDLLPTAPGEGEGNGYRVIVFQDDDEKKEKGFTEAWRAEPADLFKVTSLGKRLIGDFLFRASGKAVSLKGTRTLDGNFWPKVTFQVGNSDERWQTVGKSQHSGTPEALQITSGKSEWIRILLNAYKPHIGKFKYGKVVFSDGESGVFYLDLLNPQN